MLSYNLLKISKRMIESPNICALIVKDFSSHIVGIGARHSLSPEIILKMRGLEPECKILIINERFTLAPESYGVNKNRFCPFCAVWRNGASVTYLPLDESLKDGNYFLCASIDRSLKLNTDSVDGPDEQLYRFRRQYTAEYPCHTDTRVVHSWRTKYSAYVDMDRTSDSIGGSSWDGNLVSWFRAGFTTRVQYAAQSGLFPNTD